MFLGHFAVGLAAKRVAPRTSVATLVLAAQFLDVLWPLFLWLGIERVRIVPAGPPFRTLDFESYPWSHSLLLALLWSVAFALVYRWRRRYARGALVAGLAVFSHWVLDWASHVPDLPLAPAAAPRVGLGLWRSVPATVIVEGAMFVAGLAIYLATTRARGWAGHVSLWSIVILLVFVYVASLVGGPPPNLFALRIAGVVVAALILWFVWVERTRTLRPAIERDSA